MEKRDGLRGGGGGVPLENHSVDAGEVFIPQRRVDKGVPYPFVKAVIGQDVARIGDQVNTVPPSIPSSS